jgi:hypothetical protein
MENQTEKFIQEIDVLFKEKWAEIFKALKDIAGIQSIEYGIDPSQEMLSKYGLNGDINFSANSRTEQASYYYKGIKIEPLSFFILPDNSKEVSLLDLLQECIAQDTYEPNIKHLQVQ